jgi:hypothetical protein
MSFRFQDERAPPEQALILALRRAAQDYERSERTWRELLAELHAMRADLAEASQLLLEIKRLDQAAKAQS